MKIVYTDIEKLLVEINNSARSKYLVEKYGFWVDRGGPEYILLHESIEVASGSLNNIYYTLIGIKHILEQI